MMDELDKAIEVLQGNYDNAKACGGTVGNWLWLVDGDDYQGVNTGGLNYCGEYICTRAQFEARAKEKGWVNGYKWGKEYQCDGKKPNLPDDVVVDAFSNTGALLGRRAAGDEGRHWDVIKSFTITDHRYKPVDEAQPTNWHERGEFPSPGTECEFNKKGIGEKAEWVKCEILAVSGRWVVFTHSGFEHPFINQNLDLFRPIKTDREKFIEAVNAVLGPEKLIAIQLFDAGFKAPNNID